MASACSVMACGGDSPANGSSPAGVGGGSAGGVGGSATGGAGAVGVGGGMSTGGSSGVAGGGTGGTGGTGVEPCVPQGDLTLDAESDAAIDVAIRLNHVGYDQSGPKRAVVEASGALSGFQVVRSDDVVVFEGELAPHAGFSEWGGGPEFYVADFGCLRDAGSYRLYVNGEFSEPFAVGEDIFFDETIADVVGYFNASRADDAAIWAADEAVLFYDSTETDDVRGGWYDASGDISKYLSHLSYANHMNPQQIPLVAWGLGWVRDSAAEQLTARGLTNAVQDEALWGADYLLRVLDPAGYFYINVFDQWSGDLEARRICAYSGDGGAMSAEWQAGFREGGGMSIAALARVASWGIAGSFSAAEYLAGAEAAFSHLQTNNAIYVDDGVENVIDDYTALLAASELFAATDEAPYLEAARARAAALTARLHAEGYFIADGGSRPFWHAADAGLPVVALARYAEVETDTVARDEAVATMRTHLDYLVSVTTSGPNPYGYARQHTNVGAATHARFFVPHDNESGYWWQGENARLGSLAAAALIGGRVAYPDANGSLGVRGDLATFATDQLDWVLGKNPYDICFLNGFGRNNPPPYCSEKELHGTQVGGISNGITGQATDGSGIQWLTTESDCWQNWRWVEQWLPHSAWYMLAVTAAAL